jgi:ABC-type bacteriocin/lantibiotic exporter with double-glycine peptidase domain
MSASHFIAHVRQNTPANCWAACIAMMVNWRDGTSKTDHDIVAETGLNEGCYDSDWLDLMPQYGLTHVPGASWTPADWDRLLTPGPAIVGVPGHVVVACGYSGDDSDEGSYILVADPGAGHDWHPFLDLEARWELRAGREIHMLQFG